MRRIAAKIIPCPLNNDQQDHQVQVCTTELQKANFLHRVITGDDPSLYIYDPKTKQQSSQWKTPSSLRLKKVSQFRSNIKSMLTIFF